MRYGFAQKSGYAMFLCPFFLTIFFCFCFAVPNRFSLASSSDAPISNSIGDIVFDGTCVWVSTGEGISRTCDGGQSWQHYLSGKSFSALCCKYGRIFAASAYDSAIGGDSYPVGGKLYRATIDGDGVHWDELQPWQMTLVPGLSFVAMLSYDMVLYADGGDTVLWSANWYGGLSRSYDWGETWENILWSDSSYNVADSGTIVDTVLYEDHDTIQAFVLENGGYYHRLFYAVTVDTAASPPIVFAGTAAGIFAIQDTLWWRSRADTATGLTGNWCVALAVQYLPSGQRIVWAASRAVPDNAGEIDGICYSTDDGITWDTLATGVMVWNFAFGCDNTAFFACEQGFYKADVVLEGDSVAPQSFEKIHIEDAEDGYALPLDQMISTAVVGETLWAGSDFGIAVSTNCGEEWKILFHSEDLGWNETYAFPSPFSPYVHGTMFFVFNNPSMGDVKLSVFDFSLDEIYSSVRKFPAGSKQMFQWDGVGSSGEYPPNGIYHYRITLPGGGELWGKFAILK